MTNEEFSNEFTTLLNSYSRSGEFGEEASKADVVLDEYEKSLFLTQAQEALVITLYNGRNPLNESFEQTEQLRRYLANLVREDTLEPDSSLTLGMPGIGSYFFSLDPRLWFITYESVTISNEGSCNDGSILDVIPVTQDEYNRVKRNPFRGANNRRALRLDLSNNVIEVKCKYPVQNYYVRYVKYPAPIILEDLPDGLTINGESMMSECELHEALHRQILDRAVLLALQSRGAVKKEE